MITINMPNGTKIKITENQARRALENAEEIELKIIRETKNFDLAKEISDNTYHTEIQNIADRRGNK